MIDLMTASGGTADRSEPVRQARLLGGEAVIQGQGLDMREVLQKIGNTYHAAEQLPPNQGLATEAPSALRDSPPDTVDDPLHSVLPEVTGAGGHGLPLDIDADVLESQLPGTAWRDQSGESAGESGTAAGPVTGNLQVEQVEQWLDEQRHLQAKHGSLQAPMIGATEESLRTSDSWAYDARRLAAQPGMQPAAITQLAARADATGAMTDGRGALSQGANTLQFDVLAQAVRSEEAVLQTVTNRAGEAAAVTALSPLPQQSGAAPAAATVPVEVRLQGPEARWGEQMLQALRDQVEMQVSQRSQQATIRLDPPELGSLNIQISHEQGKLSVHINAAQADVARLLGMLSERLRHELIGQNFTEVSVGVSSDAEQGSQGRQRQANNMAGESIAAAREVEQQPTGGSHGPASDILISV